MTTATTLCFNDIFESYEDFSSYTSQFALYDPKTEPIGELLNKRIFYCLSARYVGHGVAYDTVDEFTAEFGIAYQEYFKLFMQKEMILEKIHELQGDDYLILAESLSNTSKAPNTLQTDPFELLTYTSLQSRGRTKAGRLQGFITALRTLPDAQLNYLIARFDYLWLDVIETDKIYYDF